MTDATLPVVLLHGWGGSFDATFAASGWLDRLATARRDVIAMNLPGHGDLVASQEPAFYGDLTASLLEQLPDGRVDLVGYSLGAKIALSLAVRHPERIGRVVLGGLGDNAFAPEPIGEALAQALDDGTTDDTPIHIAALIRYSEKSGSYPRALAAVLRRPANPKLTEFALSAVQAPMLLVNGYADAIALPDTKLQAAMKRLRTLHLPGIDHLSLPACVAFQDAAISFLASDRFQQDYS